MKPHTRLERDIRPHDAALHTCPQSIRFFFLDRSQKLLKWKVILKPLLEPVSPEIAFSSNGFQFLWFSRIMTAYYASAIVLHSSGLRRWCIFVRESVRIGWCESILWGEIAPGSFYQRRPSPLSKNYFASKLSRNMSNQILLWWTSVARMIAGIFEARSLELMSPRRLLAVFWIAISI